ncbi:AraC family transcriptional regulator [Candidatus Entotheonella palauensis]|uniref:HTH araC/xylS-type domain-containing protein n=1 Tax=Candidatus Entotheonella gemina TaxID=1429439 RepID=W4M5Z9_9BACT|nr:AraC family transcriptional regulator [Candidatus Entotheonella palauensis]ETX05336.1 MAG: hypothetical protein ETSY2_23560 [Candidatus Entotheonella gemina]
MNTTTAVQRQTELAYRTRINRVMRYIQDNLDEPLRLQALADVGGFSPFHFHRTFAAYVGETLAAFVRRKRLIRAARQLVNTAEPITTIALAAGYETPSAFAKAFKRDAGVTPRALRAANAPLAALIFNRLVMATSAEKVARTPMNRRNLPMHQQPDIRVLPNQQVLYVSRKGMIDQNFTQAAQAAFGILEQFLRDHHLQNKWQYCLGITPDEPGVVPPTECRFDAGYILCEGVEVTPEGEVAFQTLPAGRWAVFLHRGSYETMWQTWNVVYRDWLPASGEQLREAPPYEVYLNHPERTKPEDLETEIFIPIQ